VLLSFKLVFAYAAEGAEKIVGHVFPCRSGSNIGIDVACLRIIDISAHYAYIPHGCPFAWKKRLPSRESAVNARKNMIAHREEAFAPSAPYIPEGCKSKQQGQVFLIAVK
jgi:hypothetical protein